MTTLGGRERPLDLILAMVLVAGVNSWSPPGVFGACSGQTIGGTPVAVGESDAAEVGDRPVDLESGELAEASPKAALVYFLNPWKGGATVLLEEEPFAILPERSYLAAQIVPGTRLIWGWRSGRTASNSEWFEFRAGRTYVLYLPGAEASWGRVRAGASLGWLLETTEALSQAQTLRYANPTEDDLESLTGALKKHRVVEPGTFRPRPGQPRRRPPQVFESAFDDAKRGAGQPSRMELPALFESSFTDKIEKPKLFSLKGSGLVQGTLRVSAESLRFESKKLTLEVPITQIRRVRFAGFSQVPPGSNAPSMPLIELEYDLPGEGQPRRVYFKPAHSEHHAVSSLYNPVFAAISEALAGVP